jgi:hypothetical protein
MLYSNIVASISNANGDVSLQNVRQDVCNEWIECGMMCCSHGTRIGADQHGAERWSNLPQVSKSDVQLQRELY